MGGRFGKYGDLKRRQALQRGRREKSRLERAELTALRSRSGLLPPGQRSSHPSASKTYKTAVVAIPPQSLWGPIQGLRKQYDRHYRRWMPHITLIYPFRPVPAFEQLVPLLSEACRKAAPLEIRLARFGFFARSRQKATVYLIPEPAGPLKILQAALLEIVPDCDDVSRFPGGFTPHLSIGQVRSRDAQPFCARWQARWQPLDFTVRQVCLLRRNDPPDDVFRAGPVISLGG